MALLGSSWSVLGGFGSRMGSNMVSQSFPKCYQKLFKKWSKKLQILGSKMGARVCLNGNRRAKAFSSGVSFLSFIFSMFFFRFWSSLGASWEPSWASWGSLGRPLDPKTYKNLWFFKGYEKAVFWSLKLLMALLGSSCFFLGKSGPKMGFQNGYQKWSWTTLKIDFKSIMTNNNKFGLVQFLLPFWTSFGSHFEAHFGTQNWFKIC